MKLDKTQTKYAGIALIGIGIVAALGLWPLVPVVLMASAGVYIYRRQRRAGRVGEAVQGGLWGLGLAVLSLFGLMFPGILLLGGTSLLLRGREQQADDQVQRFVARVQSRRQRRMQATPATQNTPAATVTNSEPATTGETVRL